MSGRCLDAFGMYVRSYIRACLVLCKLAKDVCCPVKEPRVNGVICALLGCGGLLLEVGIVKVGLLMLFVD